MTTERTCRACKSRLTSVLDFGELFLSAFPIGEEKLPKAPLDFCLCEACGLVQLRHTVEPDAMFHRYWYQSGINEAMRAELADVVASGIGHLGGLADGDTVVDVGANDGTLLASYPSGANIQRIAYEPARNLEGALRQHCDVLVNDYFPSALPARGSVNILTSIACFYAVDDPIRFVEAVDTVLSRRGIWIVQFQDLHQMLKAGAFDDICHEHLFYPSLASMERLLEAFNLAIIHAETRAINGGSLRLVIGRRWRPVGRSVQLLRMTELGCEDVETLIEFASHVNDTHASICEALEERQGVVDLYGASTKGNTLLQVCGLGPNVIRQAWERSSEKWGRKTVTGIPIVSEDAGRADPPAMLFVGIWQFRVAILMREANYLKAGGKLLFPLPSVEIV